jgi:hypothetical protein
MFFYEIHEGDEDVGTAVLLAHEDEFEPHQFFQVVKKVRTLLLDSYEEDSLSEAIANELERSHGFIHVTDKLLLASVNVGETDEDTFLVTETGDTRTIFVEADEDDEDSPNGHATHSGHDHGDEDEELDA